MTIENPMSRPARTGTLRLSAAERRAAQITTLSTQQAELKHDAAQRRLAREVRDAGATPPPRKKSDGRRPRPR